MGMDGVVLELRIGRMPVRGRFIQTLEVAGEGGNYLRTNSGFINGIFLS